MPRPKRKIPIWFGGFSGATYERAARIGDGFRFSSRSKAEAVAIKVNIQARLAELGRANNDLASNPSNNTAAAMINGLSTSRHGASGGSHISFVTMGANLTTGNGHIDAIRRWRDVYSSVR